MQISCRVSGTAISVAGFTDFRTAYLHPICTMPVQTLNKLAAMQNTTTADDHLLFCALMFSTGLVKFSNPLRQAMLSPEFVTARMPEALRLANSDAKQLRQLPQLHIGKAGTGEEPISPKAQQDAVGNWLELCTDILTTGRTAHRAEVAEEHRAIRRAVATRSRAAAVAFTDILAWGFEYLHKLADFGRISDDTAIRLQDNDAELQRAINSARRFAFSNLQACCATPCKEPLQTLKDMRAMCLESLPENDAAQSAKKAALLERINANLLVRLEFFAILGNNDTETESLIAEIASTYTIVTDSGSLVNTAKPAAQSLINLLSGDADAGELYSSAQTHCITPSEQPRRENFSNAMAYTLAQRAWERANGGAQ